MNSTEKFNERTPLPWAVHYTPVSSPEGEFYIKAANGRKVTLPGSIADSDVAEFIVFAANKIQP